MGIILLLLFLPVGGLSKWVIELSGWRCVRGVCLAWGSGLSANRLDRIYGLHVVPTITLDIDTVLTTKYGARYPVSFVSLSADKACRAVPISLLCRVLLAAAAAACQFAKSHGRRYG